MKKALYIVAGSIAGIISFYLLASIFANEPEDNTEEYLSFRYAEETVQEEELEFEIIYETEIQPEEEESEYLEIETDPVPESETEAPEIKIENTYKIKTGDTFWEISEKFYGDGNYCFALAEYNDLSIDDHITTGHKLIIPSIDDEEFIDLVNKYKEEPNTDLYTLNERATPAVEITIPTGNDMRNYTGKVDTSEYQYIGDWQITGYDPNCAHCCGGNTHGIGAAGVEVIPGYSVATKDLPLNITLYIEGYGYYVNEDRGCGEGVIDIVCSSHEACYPITNLDGVAVYIVE